jgi:iron complex transport system permease protein
VSDRRATRDLEEARVNGHRRRDVLTVDPPLGIPVGSEPSRRGLFRGRSTRVLGLVVGLVALVFLALLSLAVGARSIPVASVIDAFRNLDVRDVDEVIVFSVRGPRTVIGLMVGVSLGLAGAAMQGVTRNPLADPGILGVNAGASLAVVIAISAFGITTLLGYVWFAFVGAAVVAVVVYLLGSLGREGATPVKLALAGAAATALLFSVLTLIQLLDVNALNAIRFWVVGSLAGRGSQIALQVWPFVALGTVMTLASGRLLNALALGDDVARSLGQKVGRARAFSAAGIVVLAGSAVAAAGPIAFVGLTIPHIARAITGPDYRWILPYSAVLGPILLLGADVLGRVVARPGELQVGIVTVFVGAPFFVALVRHRKLAEL